MVPGLYFTSKSTEHLQRGKWRRERGRERSMTTRRRAILVNRLRDLIPLWIDPILRAYSGTPYHAGAHSRVVIILEMLKKTTDSNSM